MGKTNNDEVFDWDSEIEIDAEGKEFVILEPGKYDFTVHAYEKGIYESASATSKIKDGCPMAIVTFKIVTDEGEAYIKETLYLAQKLEWKLSQFFNSIGMKKHGEKIKMDFKGAIGKTGKCIVTKDKGKNEGVYFNHIVTFLAPQINMPVETEDGDEPW